MNPANRTAPDRQNFAVEYAPGVLDQIRAHVTENFERTGPDGVESGGVLFGTHSRRMVTVTAMRPASCSYASGQVFILGPGDHREFEQTVALYKSDPELAGLEPVGWFLSHVRDSLVLRPSDREIFDRYFDQDWQIVLVMRPGRIGSLRAATIGRGGAPEGFLVNEFTIKQSGAPETPRTAEVGSRIAEAPVMPVKVVAASSPNIEAPPGMEPVRTIPDRSPVPAAPPRSIAVREPGNAILFRPLDAPKRSGKLWQILGIVAGVLLTVGVAATVYRNSSGDVVGLQAFEREGVMHVEWNPNARSVNHAASAKLEISQGTTTSIRTLTHEDLKRGLFAALRKQDDVSVRLRLYDSNGNVKEEQARYIGRPVSQPAPQVIVREDPQVPDLREENAALQAELSRERARAAELERRVKVQQAIIQKRDGK